MKQFYDTTFSKLPATDFTLAINVIVCNRLNNNATSYIILVGVIPCVVNVTNVVFAELTMWDATLRHWGASGRGHADRGPYTACAALGGGQQVRGQLHGQCLATAHHVYQVHGQYILLTCQFAIIVHICQIPVQQLASHVTCL